MAFGVRSGGSWQDISNIQVRNSGNWTQVKAVLARDGGVWQTVWEHLIVASLTTNQNNFDVSTLFTPEVWASNTPKEAIIETGVTVGSTAPANAALTVPDTWGGILTIRNRGNIHGAGGAANGGAGGAAINSLKAGLVVINETGAAIRGGGGGGGKGGTGGNGTHNVVERQPTTGYAAHPNSRFTYSGGTYGWYWNGGHISYSKTAPVTVGGWTYYTAPSPYDSRRVWEGTGDSGGFVDYAAYQIYRQRSVATASTGGAGGDGGRGQGSNHALAAGVAGVAGGTNAGTGGTGGSGGNWGAAGAKGANGANGNVTNGTEGSNGGAAGPAITGAARTVTNNGTISGAY